MTVSLVNYEALKGLRAGDLDKIFNFYFIMTNSQLFVIILVDFEYSLYT